MIFGRIYQTIWVQSFKLGLEWMNWAICLLILEGFSYTISNDKVCVSVNDGHEHSPQCDAIYAGLAFAGVQFVFSSISLAFVMFAVNREYKERKDRERLPSVNHDPAAV
jgi:hypothetical protein